LARRERELDEMARDAAAARALQALHCYPYSAERTPKPRPSLKRSRTSAADGNALQDHVREMLVGTATLSPRTLWPETLVRPGRKEEVTTAYGLPIRPSNIRPRKRARPSTEAVEAFNAISNSHRAGPGMWEGILN